MFWWEIADILLNNSIPFVLKGRPGTGKSFFAGQLSSIVCPLGPDTAAFELRGLEAPRDGGWVWKDGPVMEAYRHGGTLLLDEIDKASPEASAWIHGALWLKTISLPSGETVNRSAKLKIISTANDLELLPDHARDRWTVVKADYPHKDLSALIATRAGIPEESVKDILSNSKGPVASPRKWLVFCRLLKTLPHTTAAMIAFDGDPLPGDILKFYVKSEDGVTKGVAIS